jgi:hypothetical protein
VFDCLLWLGIKCMYLMHAVVRDLSYANCLKNDMLNCLYFIKKACVISMIHEMKCIDLRYDA